MVVTKLKHVWRKWLKEESLVLFSLSWPTAITLLLHSTVPLTLLVFIGHINKQKSKLLIDAASLGISLINVVGYSIIYGLSAATETLCSQAYGARNYKRVGIVMQRSVLICSLSLFPVLFVFLNAESLLLILHQSPCVARLTGKFCKTVTLALPAMYLEIVFVKYLQSQGIVRPTVITGIISNVVNIVSLTLLLFVAGLEIEGAAIAVVTGMYALLLSLMVYMFMRKPVNKTWQGLSWDSLKEWKPFLLLSLPGLIMVCSEWWTFETGGFVTGSVDGVQLAAYTITLNVIGAGYIAPYGIGIATGIRVGNMLGAGEPGKAKKSAFVGMCYSIIWSFVEMIVFLSYRNLGELFTSDREVIDAISTITYLGAAFVYSDNMQAVLGGILKGCGKQLLAAASMSVYYLLGLPVSLTLVYVADMGALGFWLGCAVGSFAQLTLMLIVVLRTNFSLESRKAQINAGVLMEDHDKTANSELRSMEEEDMTTSDTDDDIEMRALISEEESHKAQINHDQINSPATCNGELSLVEEDASVTDDDIVMRALVSEEENNTSDEEDETTSPIKLLLIRTPWYIIGLVILITGVVLSQYTIHVPYQAQCDDVHSNNLTNNTNLTMEYLSYQL